MTLKEFLEMNTNLDLLYVYIYNCKGVYILCKPKMLIFSEENLLNKIVLSFKVYNEGLSIKLDF